MEGKLIIDQKAFATVTAADDPSPEELGIWEFIYTLPMTPIASKHPSI
jgi:hypothetical protein